MSVTTDSVALLKAAQEGNFTTLEELRKDAARYRFIKRNATGAGADGGSIMLYILGPTHWNEPTGDAIDSAIDDAIKRERAE